MPKKFVPIKAGDGIVLRRYRMGDARALARIANDARIAAQLRDRFPHPYRFEDAKGFLSHLRSEAAPTALAIEYRGRLAGTIGFMARTDVERVDAQVGYWLGAAFWGKGIATRALNAYRRHLLDTQPELTRLSAVVFVTNPGSARVLEKAGFRREARLRRSAKKNGVILDQWLYALLREEPA
jgi:ribosomal-protein-alanine N-acetyltransferase